MQKGTIFLTVIGLGIGLLVWLLPERPESNEIPPHQLLHDIGAETRFFSTDRVAAMLIDRDPSLHLIDVRDEASYNKFHLPGAVNIPLDKILSEENTDILSGDEQTHVFYSNGTIRANQAWVLTRRMGYMNTYVMQGGLNRWIETIMNPPLPPSSASSDAFDLYDFRVAAGNYFRGETAAPVKKKNTPVKVVPRKKRKVVASGGC
jgi:rhodanese-related sulfurtransferase